MKKIEVAFFVLQLSFLRLGIVLSFWNRLNKKIVVIIFFLIEPKLTKLIKIIINNNLNSPQWFSQKCV